MARPESVKAQEGAPSAAGLLALSATVGASRPWPLPPMVDSKPWLQGAVWQAPPGHAHWPLGTGTTAGLPALTLGVWRDTQALYLEWSEPVDDDGDPTTPNLRHRWTMQWMPGKESGPAWALTADAGTLRRSRLTGTKSGTQAQHWTWQVRVDRVGDQWRWRWRLPLASLRQWAALSPKGPWLLTLSREGRGQAPATRVAQLLQEGQPMLDEESALAAAHPATRASGAGISLAAARQTPSSVDAKLTTGRSQLSVSVRPDVQKNTLDLEKLDPKRRAIQDLFKADASGSGLPTSTGLRTAAQFSEQVGKAQVSLLASQEEQANAGQQQGGRSPGRTRVSLRAQWKPFERAQSGVWLSSSTQGETRAMLLASDTSVKLNPKQRVVAQVAQTATDTASEHRLAHAGQLRWEWTPGKAQVSYSVRQVEPGFGVGLGNWLGNGRQWTPFEMQMGQEQSSLLQGLGGNLPVDLSQLPQGSVVQQRSWTGQAQWKERVLQRVALRHDDTQLSGGALTPTAENSYSRQSMEIGLQPMRGWSITTQLGQGSKWDAGAGERREQQFWQWQSRIQTMARGQLTWAMQNETSQGASLIAGQSRSASLGFTWNWDDTQRWTVVALRQTQRQQQASQADLFDRQLRWRGVWSWRPSSRTVLQTGLEHSLQLSTKTGEQTDTAAFTRLMLQF